MKRCAVIADGYTEPGYIKEVSGIHGDVRFTFRPMTVDARSALYALSDKMKPEAYDQKCAAELAAHLTSWDITDGKDVAVPISAKATINLKPLLFNRLLSIVVGQAATDLDPDWDEDAKQLKAQEEALAAATGRIVAAVREETAEKN